ncbi:hypothetical protein DK871_15785 [Pseudomonas sp. L13]|nr:hypothetical protein [Pseudomonas sp. L13]
MQDNTDSQIATADVLTLLWEGQLALAAGIEEIALWVRTNGSPDTHENVIDALRTLDRNAAAITTGILKLRR